MIHPVISAFPKFVNRSKAVGWPRDCFKDFTYLPPPVVPQKDAVGDPIFLVRFGFCTFLIKNQGCFFWCPFFKKEHHAAIISYIYIYVWMSLRTHFGSSLFCSACLPEFCPSGPTRPITCHGHGEAFFVLGLRHRGSGDWHHVPVLGSGRLFLRLPWFRYWYWSSCIWFVLHCFAGLDFVVAFMQGDLCMHQNGSWGSWPHGRSACWWRCQHRKQSVPALRLPV